MISSKRVSNAVGGKTARACDSCVKKRARWYCAADDAFLCQACDSSVHSANSLARRHERLRLKTSSLKPAADHIDQGEAAPLEKSAPSWHRGFTRKARTPRHGKHVTHHQYHKSRKYSKEKNLQNPFSLVPEVGGDDSTTSSHEENEDDQQLLYRVPIFDPFVADHQLRAETTNTDHDGNSDGILFESKVNISSVANSGHHEVENVHGFLPSEMDLAEFAADVESLLGRGLENECFGMEELGLMDCKENESTDQSCLGSGKVKVEVEDTKEGPVMEAETETDMMREPFELNFEDYDSPASCGDEDDKVAVEMKPMKNGGVDENEGDNDAKNQKKKILLKLDYEAVIRAWDSHGSPWTTGDRPEFGADDCWPDCMVSTSSLPISFPFIRSTYCFLSFKRLKIVFENFSLEVFEILKLLFENSKHVLAIVFGNN